MDRYREYLKTKENIVEKAEIETPKQVDKEITNNLVNESDSLKGLKLTFHFSENDFNIPDETTLVGKEAYDLLQKIIDFDKEQNKVQQIINKEIEEGKENTHGLSYYKTYISLSNNDIPLLKNSRIDLGDLEFGKEKEVSKALDEYLTSIPKDRINDPIEYANFSKEYLHKKITPEEIISENLEHKPKNKFSVPFGTWLKEEKWYLKVKEFFSEEFVSEFFKTDAIIDLLDDHFKGNADNGEKIYLIYAFLVWYKVFFILDK